jgi:hypothetical protein
MSALLPGCVLSRRTQNEPLRAESIAQLVPGKTTAMEAVALLGAPTEVVQLGKRTAYRYDHARTKDTGLVLIVLNMFNSDTRADRAWVFFDENEVLTHAAASLKAHEASWALPWQSIRSK